MYDFSDAITPPFISEEDSEKLKIKFDGVENFTQNYSQAHQDLFVLSILNGKQNGTYVEIGGAHPINISNTYLLEKYFGWYGIAFEIDCERVDYYNEKRKNKCICGDATNLDYSKIFKENNLPKQIDYLQVDIEPAWQTFESLKQIDLDTYRFSVITFETDTYMSENKNIVIESRNLLERYGYKLISKNVKTNTWPFEDWYIDPLIVSENVYSQFYSDGLESIDVLYK